MSRLTPLQGMIASVAQTLREEDFVCTITIEPPDRVYDVYRFTWNNKRGTLALRLITMPDGTKRAEIPVMLPGEPDEAKVRERLLQAIN